MPPSKGRMQGAQSSRMTGPRLAQPKLAFKAAKHLSTTHNASLKSSAPSFKSGNFKDLKHTEQLKKLRIPEKICKLLPSVRRYANSKGYIDTTDSKQNVATNLDGAGEILGTRRTRGVKNRYRVHQLSEKKFSGMIWNVSFLPSSEPDLDPEVIVSTSTGTYICDLDLNVKLTLENIKLPGGVAVMSDRRIVAICRFFDVVNVYSPVGALLATWPGGDSPMNVAVNSMDEIIVTDISEKCVRMFRADGSLVRIVPQVGTGYHMKWPLYVAVTTDDQILVCDCHQQQLLLFGFRGDYVRTVPLRTSPCSEVLRPHGVCVADDNDILVIDNATDSVEAFTRDGRFLQNLVPGDKGGHLKPKVLDVSPDVTHLAIGGMSGTVCLYRFLDEDEQTIKPQPPEVDVKITPKVEPLVANLPIKAELESDRDLAIVVKADQDDEVVMVIDLDEPIDLDPDEHNDSVILLD